MESPIKKVARLIQLGREIEATMPELASLQFVVPKCNQQEIEKVATEYNTHMIYPANTNLDYRTTVLDSKVKILVRSKLIRVDKK